MNLRDSKYDDDMADKLCMIHSKKLIGQLLHLQGFKNAWSAVDNNIYRSPIYFVIPSYNILHFMSLIKLQSITVNKMVKIY